MRRAPLLETIAKVVTLAVVASVSACAPKNEMRPPTDVTLNTHADASSSADGIPRASGGAPSESKVDQVGEASWYGGSFAGKPTANGEIFDPRLYTAAHRKLPFGTWVEVRRVDTGRTVRVRINDRGPRANVAGGRRIIDLSRKAAEDLDLVRAGVVTVELRIVQGP